MLGLDSLENLVMHPFNGALKLANVDVLDDEVSLPALLFQVGLDSLVPVTPLLPLLVDCFVLRFDIEGTSLCSFGLLHMHGQTTLYAQAVALRVNCEQKWNDQAATLIDLLHLLLHDLKSTLYSIFRWGYLCDNSVLLHPLWSKHSGDVSRRIDVRAINNEGLSVGEALTDVEVTAVTNSAASALEHGNRFFIGLRL